MNKNTEKKLWNLAKQADAKKLIAKQSYKPFLFKTEMVKAILKSEKTQTRRNIKMRDGSLAREEDISFYENGKFDKVMDASQTGLYWRELKPKAQVGDIIWVRETFSEGEEIIYRADVCSKHDLPDGRKRLARCVV